MQRSYVIEDGNREIRLDFGKGNDTAVEVVAENIGGKIHVVYTRTMGKSKYWRKERINAYLLRVMGIEDPERDDD